MLDLNGDTVRLDTGQVLEYLPWKVDVDISGKPFEKVAGARMKKYAIDKTATKDGKLMDNDIVLFRYADVLLLAAELDVRINGTASADAQGWFDQVRDRAFKDKEHRINLAGKSKQELLDILFEERGYEFMDEMQRWFDILRFDKGTEILGNKGWTEKFRYFPIDQSEMDRAKGGLTQNPGWL